MGRQIVTACLEHQRAEADKQRAHELVTFEKQLELARLQAQVGPAPFGFLAGPPPAGPSHGWGMVDPELH